MGASPTESKPVSGPRELNMRVLLLRMGPMCSCCAQPSSWFIRPNSTIMAERNWSASSGVGVFPSRTRAYAAATPDSVYSSA